MSLRVGYIVVVDKKNEANINCSGKDGSVTFCYYVSTCKKMVNWTLMVSYFMQEEGYGVLGDRKIVILEKTGRSPRDDEARKAICCG